MESYKVAVFTFNPPISYKSNNKYFSTTTDIWDHIKKELNKKGFHFKETYLDYSTFDKTLEDIKKEKYDILIGALGTDFKLFKFMDFTLPLFLETPRVYYDPLLVSEIHWGNYFKKMISIWYKPFIFFFITGIVLSFIIFKLHNKKNLQYNIYEIISGFFGQTGGIVGNIDNTNYRVITFSVIILMIIFITNLYVSATTISSSVNYLSNSNILEYNLKGVKTLVTKYNIEWIKSFGAIPVIPPKNMEKESLIDIYLTKKGIADCFIDSIETKKIIDKNKKKYASIKESNIHLGFYLNSFGVNKKKKKILKAINNEIIKMQTSLPGQEPMINIICSRYSDEKYLCDI